ncbi:beta-lactamase-like protein [Mycena floridula]|nr:beta-lactamase-like protein [Mycena floridula]
MLSLASILVILPAVLASTFANLGIPKSSETVDVKMFDVLTHSPDTFLPAVGFLFPVIPGRENLDINMYAFLIEHSKTGKRAMFDLGLRKDFNNSAPFWKTQSFDGIIIEQDIVTQLHNGNISLESIESVFWSHSHLDHVGDMSLWPNSTKLVIGPDTDTRTFPTFPNASLLETDLAGRDVVKVNFSNSTLAIGGFPAVDFFGDGSFYLLDVPGHCPGHMAGLARVTPTSFILLAGDAFHNVGQIRPSEHLHDHYPIPQEILDESRLNINRKYFFAPDDNTDLSTERTPFFTVANVGAYSDPPTARISQLVTTTFDSNPDVLVITAHDPAMEGILQLFPKSIRQWKQSGVKDEGIWLFAKNTTRGYRLS